MAGEDNFGPRRLGASGLQVSALGVGTNRWGGRGVSESAYPAILDASIDAGVSFFDTAEVYMMGRSERVLGQTVASAKDSVVVASKFAPFPTRLVASRLDRALDATLRRMGRQSIDLYYLHFPFSLVRIEAWMDRMAEAVGAGKIKAVGVSNCGVSLMRRAHDALARHGIALAANQVQYSLSHRKPERDGVLAACRDLDVALVAYRPLRGGELPGAAGTKQSELSSTVAAIAAERGVRPSQVALNWLLCKDELIIPIPGATKAAHAAENAGALAWRLEAAELDRLDACSA